MIYNVEYNRPLSPTMMRMRLEGDTSAFTHTGQFVNIRVDGCFLRRPISVCRYDTSGLELVYQIVGRGTSAMAALAPGTKLDLLAPLGNGFDIDSMIAAGASRPALLGGGVGIAPLPGLCEELLKRGITPTVVLGFNTAADVVLREDFLNMGIDPLIATVDGTCGSRGFVTDALRSNGVDPDYFFACGPLPMLRSLCLDSPWTGQVSLDSRMACGFGVCMCCSVHTSDGARRVCKDGPVFLKNELIWE